LGRNDEFHPEWNWKNLDKKDGLERNDEVNWNWQLVKMVFQLPRAWNEKRKE
jgi:gluconate kinase